MGLIISEHDFDEKNKKHNKCCLYYNICRIILRTIYTVQWFFLSNITIINSQQYPVDEDEQGPYFV
jgi:hypothetical protein